MCLETEVSSVNTADEEESIHLNPQVTCAQILEDKLLADQLENLCVYEACKSRVGEQGLVQQLIIGLVKKEFLKSNPSYMFLCVLYTSLCSFPCSFDLCSC